MSLDNSRLSTNNRSLEDSRSSVPNSSRENSISPSKRIHNWTLDNSRSSLQNSSRDNSISPSKRIHNRSLASSFETSRTSFNRSRESELELTNLRSNSAQLNLDSSTEYISDTSAVVSERGHSYYTPRQYHPDIEVSSYAVRTQYDFLFRVREGSFSNSTILNSCFSFNQCFKLSL